jgi:hypothetical protein
LRWVYFLDRRERIRLYRLRCRPCGITATLLPDFLRPHTRYALDTVQSAIEACASGASCRTTALAISGVALPPGPSVTDALTWTRLVPGYQRVHAWLRAVAAIAGADVTEAAAWLVRRKPDALAVDLLTSPGDHQASIQVAWSDVRALARLFTDPTLDPMRRGWMRAWQQFSAVILGRRPWAGPSRSPPSHGLRDVPSHAGPGNVPAHRRYTP